MQTVIDIDNIKKRFGDTEVLKGISFQIQQGEIFGFVGHNGAGKSTLIHILTGIVQKSSGSFQCLNTSDDHLDDVKKRIGVMPDIANLYQHMKGVGFLQYMGSLVGDPRSKEECEQLLQRVGLEDAGDKKIKTYSFGMKKKISIAQALLGQPELIILDEPTSGIDPESAIDIRHLMTELQQQGKTIFLTSHNLDEIEKICDRVGILSEGVMKRIGSPQALKMNEQTGVPLVIRTEPVLDESLLQKMTTELDESLTLLESRQDDSVVNVSDMAIIPELTKLLVAKNINVFEIKLTEQSLEDVFMEAKSS